jgi:hypothetical protein
MLSTKLLFATKLTNGLLFVIFALFAVIFPNGNAAAQKKLLLAANGKSLYSIYLDPSAPTSVKEAAEDVRHYISKSTKATLKIIVSAEVPAEPFISLGNTVAAKKAEVSVSGIADDGYRIVTKAKNIFIIGADTKDGAVNLMGGVSNGTANGVYTFLEDYLHIRWLTPDASDEIIPVVTSLSVPVINRTESSPFVYRVVPNTGKDEASLKWQKRMKLGRVAALEHEHSWEETIPALLFEQHADWFAQVNGQRQKPGHRYKLETTNPGLVKAFADSIITRFKRNPELRCHSLSPADGSFNWSESAETKALLEKDPFGKVSRTSLVLKFYNDVAKIVRKEFPNHKLGGYIYSSYLYPPMAGVPKLEPNLALVIAPSIAYGFQLYRSSSRQNWDQLIKYWAESSKKDGFDLYYYDLPTWVKPSENVILPTSPEILNFVFSGLKKYQLKGSYVYGTLGWGQFASANYVISRLTWNPAQEAGALFKEYYQLAYGAKAAPIVEEIYTILGEEFRTYYNKYSNANYSFTDAHLKEIYAPKYAMLETLYLKALGVTKDASHKKRLQILGETFTGLQADLISKKLLPANYISPLTGKIKGNKKLLIQTKDD